MDRSTYVYFHNYLFCVKAPTEFYLGSQTIGRRAWDQSKGKWVVDRAVIPGSGVAHLALCPEQGIADNPYHLGLYLLSFCWTHPVLSASSTFPFALSHSNHPHLFRVLGKAGLHLPEVSACC